MSMSGAILCIWNPVVGELSWMMRNYFEKMTATPELLPLPALIMIDPDLDVLAQADIDHQLYAMIAIIQACPQHTFYLPTRYPERAGHLLEPFQLPNLWIGVKVANQNEAHRAIPRLLNSTGFSKFVLYEHPISQVTLEREWLQSIPAYRELPALDRLDEVWILPAAGKQSQRSMQLLQRECRDANVTYRPLSALADQSKVAGSQRRMNR